jgi:hypothetical protein
LVCLNPLLIAGKRLRLNHLAIYRTNRKESLNRGEFIALFFWAAPHKGDYSIGGLAHLSPSLINRIRSGLIVNQRIIGSGSNSIIGTQAGWRSQSYLARPLESLFL